MKARKYVWEVWRDDCRTTYFPTLEAAERYAHRYVAQLDGRGFARHADIYHEFDHVAVVRMSGDGRVWTDVVDCTAA